MVFFRMTDPNGKQKDDDTASASDKSSAKSKKSNNTSSETEGNAADAPRRRRMPKYLQHQISTWNIQKTKLTLIILVLILMGSSTLIFIGVVNKRQVEKYGGLSRDIYGLIRHRTHVFSE